MSRAPLSETAVPSSSPGFSTPVPLVRRAREVEAAARPSVLPIVLPAATLRPIAFRIFTKKHNLNLTSSALDQLAQFIGTHCGSSWREGAAAEKVLDEAAKQWKKSGGGVLVQGEGNALESILRQILAAADSQHGDHLTSAKYNRTSGESTEATITNGTSSVAAKPPTFDIDRTIDGRESSDPRRWMNIISAMAQPRLSYNPERKHFETLKNPPSFLPDAARRNAMFRERYNIIHQRLLRNESFQNSAVRSRERSNRRKPSADNDTYKLTLIANLLGRGGSQHLLFGLLARSPSGYLTLHDPSGSIVLDLQFAQESYEDAAWFTPGMIVIVDGQYADTETKIGAELSGDTGVGGTIAGSFLVFGLIGPPSERRDFTLGIGSSTAQPGSAFGAGYGWVDFLGIGSEKSVGESMRSVEKQLLNVSQQSDSGDGRCKILFLGEVNLDLARTIRALKKVLALYAASSKEDIPMAVVLMGNFASHGVMSGRASDGSVDYKEYFDSLASVLSDYPNMLHSTTFVFVPGDNDPWPSSYSAGASTLIPRAEIPEVFTSRIKRVFANANAEQERITGKKATGEAVWSTNPARITFCGTRQECVIFRDEISGRLRRNAIALKSAPSTSSGGPGTDHGVRPNSDISPTELHDTDNGTAEKDPKSFEQQENLSHEVKTSRKIVKTVIDQGHLSPFPLSSRPVHWDYSNALHLYPLPTALVMMDPEAPCFTIGLDGCHVMNPGPLTPANRKGVAQWIEYSLRSRRGRLKEAHY